jgi:hypothetical protein
MGRTEHEMLKTTEYFEQVEIGITNKQTNKQTNKTNKMAV